MALEILISGNLCVRINPSKTLGHSVSRRKYTAYKCENNPRSILAKMLDGQFLRSLLYQLDVFEEDEPLKKNEVQKRLKMRGKVSNESIIKKLAELLVKEDLDDRMLQRFRIQYSTDLLYKYINMFPLKSV